MKNVTVFVPLAPSSFCFVCPIAWFISWFCWFTDETVDERFLWWWADFVKIKCFRSNRSMENGCEWVVSLFFWFATIFLLRDFSNSLIKMVSCNALTRLKNPIAILKKQSARVFLNFLKSVQTFQMYVSSDIIRTIIQQTHGQKAYTVIHTGVPKHENCLLWYFRLPAWLLWWFLHDES